MCTAYKIDGEYIETMGALKKAIGAHNIVISPHYGFPLYPACIWEDDLCLCSVDGSATASRIGRILDTSDCFWWEFVQGAHSPTG